MGIQGLLPFIKKASTKSHIRKYSGQTAAVDGYGWLYKGAFGCAVKLGMGEPTDAYVRYIMKHIEVLVENGVRPVIVFDGRSLPAKALTNQKRRENRTENRKIAIDLMRKGDKKKAWEYFIRSLEVTHEMVQDVIQVLRQRHIDYIVAPYEADAQLAYLSRKGIVDIVITEDSDLVVFGVKKALFKFKVSGDCVLYEDNKLHKVMDATFEKFEFDRFRHMCILSGCDYLDSLPGVGLIKAKKFIMYAATLGKPVPEILSLIPGNLKLDIEVSKEYIKDFMEAENSFLYQLVFDPISRKLVPLNPYPATLNPEDMTYAGVYDVSEEVAFHLAVGNVHTKTLKRLGEYDVDRDKGYQCTTTSIWSRKFSSGNSLSSEKFSVASSTHSSTKGLTMNVSLKSIVKKRQLDTGDAFTSPAITDRELVDLYREEGNDIDMVNGADEYSRSSKKVRISLESIDFSDPNVLPQSATNEKGAESMDEEIDPFVSPRKKRNNPFLKSPDIGLRARAKILTPVQDSVVQDQPDRNRSRKTDEISKTEPVCVIQKNHVYGKEKHPKLIIKSKYFRTSESSSSQSTSASSEMDSASLESQVSIYSVDKSSLPETESQLLEDMLASSTIESSPPLDSEHDVITLDDGLQDSSYFGSKVSEQSKSATTNRKSPRSLSSGKTSQRNTPASKVSPGCRSQGLKRGLKPDSKQRSVMEMFASRSK